VTLTIFLLNDLMHKVIQKLVNLKQSLELTGMSISKPAIEFVERYHSVVSCALDMGNLISKQYL
jgi:hypothetical protein